MKIELKKVQHVARMSQETECFIAELWINGVKRGTVENDGHGGSDLFSDRKAQDELNAYAKTLPNMPSPYFPDGLPMDAELLVGDVLAKHLEEKQLRKWCKTKTVFRLPGDKEGQWRTIKGTNPMIAVQINKQYPEAEILNLRFVS